MIKAERQPASSCCRTAVTTACFTRSLSRGVFYQMSLVHRHNAVSLLRGIRGVSHHQHRCALTGIFPQRFEDNGGVTRIEIAGRLVGQQQRRLMKHRPRQGDPLLLAHAQFGRHMMNTRLETEPFDQLLGSLHRAGVPQRNVRRQDILENVQVGDQVKLLKHEADFLSSERAALVRGQLVRIDIVHQDRAAGGPQQRSSQQQQGALAASAGPPDGNGLVVGDRKRKPIHGLDHFTSTGIGFGNVLQQQHRSYILQNDGGILLRGDQSGNPAGGHSQQRADDETGGQQLPGQDAGLADHLDVQNAAEFGDDRQARDPPQHRSAEAGQEGTKQNQHQNVTRPATDGPQHCHFGFSPPDVQQRHQQNPRSAGDHDSRNDQRCQVLAFRFQLYLVFLLPLQGPDCFLRHIVARLEACQCFGAELDDLGVRQDFCDRRADSVDGRVADANALQSHDRIDLARLFQQFLGVFQGNPNADIFFAAALRVAFLDGEFAAHEFDFLTGLEAEALLQFVPDNHGPFRHRLHQRRPSVLAPAGYLAAATHQEHRAVHFRPLHLLG